MRAERAVATPPINARSRVGTGRSMFLVGVDGRSLTARRYREVFATLLSELPCAPSQAQVQIARRATLLCVEAETMEAALVAGRPVDIGLYSLMANTLRRLLADLRANIEVGNGRPADIGPSNIIIEYIDPHNPEDMEKLHAESKIS
jgi:hypothetical protein